MIGLLALTAGWSFAEGLLFFLVADVPIGWIALRHGWRAGLKAALIAAPAAALGGLVMALWTGADPGSARAALIVLPAVDAAMVEAAAQHWAEGGYLAMAQAAFQGAPYKLYAHAWALSPQGGAVTFLAGSALARLPRFALMALVLGTLGQRLTARFPTRVQAVLYAACWAVFYAWYWWTMPG